MNKQQLAESFYKQSYNRWGRASPINPEVFMQLVVDECIKVIKETKGPSKLVAISNIRTHFGCQEVEPQDESLQV
jgi:hypothetical protein